MKTDTPRTDAALVDHMPSCSEWSQHYLDLSTFARQIERELAASQSEAERLRGQLTRAVSIAVVLIADIDDFHGNASDDKWTTSGWNDSRISKSLLQGLREEIK